MATAASHGTHINARSILALALVVLFSSATLLTASAVVVDAKQLYLGSQRTSETPFPSPEIDQYNFNALATLCAGVQRILWGDLSEPGIELILSAMALTGSIELYRRRSGYPRMLLLYGSTKLLLATLDALTYGYLAAHTAQVLRAELMSEVSREILGELPLPYHGVTYMWTKSQVLEMVSRYGPGLCAVIWFAVYRVVYKRRIDV